MPTRIATFRPGHLPPPEARRRDYERRKPRREDIAFYQGKPWRDLRAAVLADRPLCERCRAAGLVVVASHVHHILERKQRPDLALDAANLEPLCGPCHSRHHASQ